MLLVAAALLVISLGAVLGQYAFNYFETEHQAALRSQATTETKAKLMQALGSLPNVSPADLQGGFWFVTSGDEGSQDVYGVDVNALAGSGVSDAGIANLQDRVGMAAVVSSTSIAAFWPSSAVCP